jgi:hypothetical protein
MTEPRLRGRDLHEVNQEREMRVALDWLVQMTGKSHSEVVNEIAVRTRDRNIYLDFSGRLCVQYPRPYWTKKRAIGDFEINGSVHHHPKYQQGVPWKPSHGIEAWAWYQPLKGE